MEGLIRGSEGEWVEHRICRAVKIFREAKMVAPQHPVFVQTRVGCGCQ